MSRKNPPISNNRYSYENPDYDRSHELPGPTAEGDSRAVNRRGRRKDALRSEER